MPRHLEMPGHLEHLQMPGRLGDATDVRTGSNEDIRMDGFHYLLSLWSILKLYFLTSIVTSQDSYMLVYSNID